jgi:ribosomal protein S4E
MKSPERGIAAQNLPVERKKTSINAKDNPSAKLKDGARCKVVGGVHAGKSGIVRDIKTSKSGFITIAVVQANGNRFKTLPRNTVIP